MKIFGEDLGRAGRWYLVLPPLLLISFLIGLFFLAAAAQRRLNAANERVHSAEVRDRALNEFGAVVTTAESEQRGYLLSGDEAYRQAFVAAAAKIMPALTRLQEAYPPLSGPVDEVATLRRLSDRKLRALVEGLNSYQRGTAATDAVRIDEQTTEEILGITDRLRGREGIDLSAATLASRSDLRLSRWVTNGGAMLNIGLVVLATFLVYGDMRRRGRQATALRDQKQELARQVEERTCELTALSTHLQGVAEQEKSALSRELHDELGGLLVAARMDLSWLQLRLPTSDPTIEQRFKRIHESLSAGVDLKRRVVEELRPTLLDNMGLFSALRWQFKESCRRIGLDCTEQIPEDDMKFNSTAAIGVFRVAQEALTNILKHAEARSAGLLVDIRKGSFVLQVSDDGKGFPAVRSKASTSHGVSAMKHRIAALGGTWQVHSPATGGTIVTAQIPMASMLGRSAESVPESVPDAALQSA